MKQFTPSIFAKRLKEIGALCVIILLFPFLTEAQDSVKVNAYFEKIRKNEALLQNFFTQMPKGGDLHNHLTGSVYAETYFDFAIQQGCWIDTSGPSFTLFKSNDPKLDKRKCKQLVPSDQYNHALRIKAIDAWSIRNFNNCKSELACDEFFFGTFRRFGAAATNEYLPKLLCELQNRAKQENVQYLEIMLASPTVPADFPRKTVDSLQLVQLIGKKDSIALRKTLEQLYQNFELDKSPMREAVKEYVSLIASTDSNSCPANDITCLYQAYAGRNADPWKVFAQLYVGFKSTHLERKLVGVNIVQAENGELSLRDYWGHMQMFKFLKEKTFTKTTMHAGELNLGLVLPEDLHHHISDAILIANADRIGHGVDIAYEKNALELLKYMKVNKKAVEINLSSNEFILGVKDSEHPLLFYIERGVPVILSTDDAGILRTNLSQQYVLAAMRYPEISYYKFKEIVRNSIIYSFADVNMKQELLNKLNKKLVSFEEEIVKTLY